METTPAVGFGQEAMRREVRTVRGERWGGQTALCFGEFDRVDAPEAVVSSSIHGGSLPDSRGGIVSLHQAGEVRNGNTVGTF
jgi:hypothetical protein